MDRTGSPQAPAYRFVEGLHLRQWAMRVVAPLAAVATNGAGLLSIDALPHHDAPGVSPAAEVALRIAGAGLVLAAAALRVAAKGVLVRRTELTTGGVYAMVRHPFYLANLVGALGVFLLAGSLGAVVGAIWLAAASPLYAATIAGEEAALARLHPGFAPYAARVRALAPRLPRADSPRTPITWANLVAENEPPRLLRFLAGAAAVASLTFKGSAAVAGLIVAALLYVTSFWLHARTDRT